MENYRPKTQTTSRREVEHTFGRRQGRERALPVAYYEMTVGSAAHGNEYDARCRPWQRDPMHNRAGVYPGSFNPPTLAHVEIALAACAAHRLDRLDLAVSVAALGKAEPVGPPLSERIDVIEASLAEHGSLRVVVTHDRLIADIATGYDVVVMGADKWQQVNDVAWYEDTDARDAAVASLPTLALVPRRGFTVPPEHRLDLSDDLLDVSSSAVRAGRLEWMTPAARAHHDRTGAWRAATSYASSTRPTP